MHTAQLVGRLLLRFDPALAHAREDLSTAVQPGDGSLWVAADELGSLDRLTPSDPRVFGDHQRVHLRDHLPPADRARLPRGAEVDVEALAVDAGSLWVCGSHSLKRKKPKGRGGRAGLERLATVEPNAGSFLLARLPLGEGGLGGGPKPRAGGARTDTGGAGRKAGAARGRQRPDAASAATAPEAAVLQVPGRKRGEEGLVALLADDPHLAPFVRSRGPGLPALPAKDNGLDVEGMAVVGDTLLLGLRGPVLRGWAVLLELTLDSGPRTLGLRADRQGRRYRKHLLHLDGLGIRELRLRGEDLFILAGPTLAHDGPIRLFRLLGGASPGKEALHRPGDGRLERLFDLPHGEFHDKAEGLALFSYFEENDSALVVYDTPSPERMVGRTDVFADVFRLP